MSPRLRSRILSILSWKTLEDLGMICISPGLDRSSWFNTHGEVMLGRLEALLRTVTTGRGAQVGVHRGKPRIMEAYRRLGRAETGAGFGQFLCCFLSPFKFFCVVYILLWVRKRQRVFCFEQHAFKGRSGRWLVKLCASVSLFVKLLGRPGGSLRTTCEVVLSLEDKTLSRSPWGHLD